MSASEAGMPTLGALLEGIAERAAWRSFADRAVTGVFDDSRKVLPGGIFVALNGTRLDGRRFVGEAVQRGALAIVGEQLEPGADALVLNVADSRTALAKLASRWHGLDRHVGRDLKLLGVTGTNGKSTTAQMTRAILRAAGLRCGMLGTVQHDLGARTVTSEMTTPGPVELASYLRECADASVNAVVMEVSSHALDQRRTSGVRFAAAAFTNLTQDHLDYHETMERYADAKARLFAELEPDAVAVVNADDPSHERMIRDCRAKVLTYGIDCDADVSASMVRDTIDGTKYRACVAGHLLALDNALIGRHNVYNALAAAGLGHALGATSSDIQRGLESVRNIPGRLQRVCAKQGVGVFVDYAHTPDALSNVARVLRRLTKGRLIVVFGCGGDRDRAKRPKMGAAVAQSADVAIVTSDNPRSEDPRRIIEEILPGFGTNARPRVVVEPDRRAAIGAALRLSRTNDTVLIAGKGHETYQIVGDEKRRFDDVEVAIQACAARSENGQRSVKE